MGFWSQLAAIGGDIGGAFIGDPALGHQALGLYNAATSGGDGPSQANAGPSTASKVGQTAGSIEKQRMDALIAQAKLQQEQDQLGLNRTNAGVNVGTLGLAQKKLALSAPNELAAQSARGDVLANSQDATVSGLPSYIHMPTMSGGLRPSMLSASSRALGGQMSRNALADSTSGKYTNLPALPTVPGATPLPSASAFDKILQGGAIGGSFLDALKGIGGGGHPSPSGSPTGDSAALPSGDVGPNQSTDPAFAGPTQEGDPAYAIPNPENADAGLSPEVMAWLKQQADPALGGVNG